MQQPARQQQPPDLERRIEDDPRGQPERTDVVRDDERAEAVRAAMGSCVPERVAERRSQHQKNGAGTHGITRGSGDDLRDREFDDVGGALVAQLRDQDIDLVLGHDRLDGIARAAEQLVHGGRLERRHDLDDLVERIG